MVRSWCHENIVSFLDLVTLVRQLLSLHHLSFLLVLLVLSVSFLSLLDMGISGRLATSRGYSIDLLMVSGKRQRNRHLCYL
jgi:hypothetical protein